MRLARLALDGLTAFTTWPLRLVSLVGVLFAVLAMAYASYLVIDYLVSGNAVSGWTTIVTAVLFFAGVNLISLGVVGEYVSRIFDEVKGRPLFVVRRRQGEPPILTRSHPDGRRDATAGAFRLDPAGGMVPARGRRLAGVPGLGAAADAA